MTEKITRIFDILEAYKFQFKDNGQALAEKRSGAWKYYSSKDYLRIVDELSLGLLEMGVKKGDKVSTILFNSPEWVFLDMAIAQTGAIHVPIYPTISNESYEYIFQDSDIKFLFLSFPEVFERIKSILKNIKTLEGVVSLDFKIEGQKTFEDIILLGQKSEKQTVLEALKKSILPGDLNSIIYTSGTTGTPKGVMLSHKNIVSNALETGKILSQNPVKSGLSFLPLCHIYERVINYSYQLNGISIRFVHSIDLIGDMIKETGPEMFSAVPRLLEKTYGKIMDKGRNLPYTKKLIFHWALNVGSVYEPWAQHSAIYRFKLAVARKLVFSKWKEALGGNLDVIISGGASLQENLARQFWAAGFKVLEGYGLTETSPVIAVGQFIPGGVKIGTVGPVLPGVDIKIAPDGEILCKGPNVMMGYYNRPDLDKEVFDEEGWFHTGDIGVMEGKYLRITDRKKEIFKTSGGKYVAPQVIEIKFKASPFIENIMVVGEGKHFAGALIIPDFQYLRSWCKVKNHPFISPDEAIRDSKILVRIQKEVDKFNDSMDHTGKIKKFVLLNEEWTMDNQCLSPTLKLKRKFLVNKYAGIIEGIYAG
jgi:long-chain acyl-CoA synthetase